MNELLQQYKWLLDQTAVVSKTDPKGVITYANDKFCEISGYAKEELIGKKHNILKSPHTDPAVYRELWKTISSKRVWSGIIHNRAKDGREYIVKTIIMPIVKNGKILEYIASRIDVTELILQERMIQNRFRDSLTGCKNRNALLYDLAKKNGEKATFIVLDINRFADLNYCYGFEKGDLILKQFAKKLFTRHNHDNIYRISGDEFAILCYHEFDRSTKEFLTSQIDSIEKEGILLDNEQIPLSLSCGVAYDEAARIYEYAHIALEYNKRFKESLTIYHEHMHLDQEVKKGLSVTNMIKQAITEDRVFPVFQGIVDNASGKIVKYEVLMRIENENASVISPEVFLPYAKKAKIYTRLTKMILTKAFACFENDFEHTLSINLTPEDLLDDSTVALIIDLLERYRCGEQIIFEIVESEMIEDYEEVCSFIQKVKRYNCKIAIDDFGSGYSNFTYLARLSIDFVKIDASLIKNIHTNESHHAIVESIIRFTKKLKLQTIAEYVENESIYNVVRKLGADFSQGYYFSVPIRSIC